MTAESIRVYSDYKSPYAYLAKDLVYALEQQTGAIIEWLPYTLNIPSFLGSAQVAADGSVLEESRNAHQWRRVKYSYMDCRREANLRGLTLRGPKKIFDSNLAHVGMLFAQDAGVFRQYHDIVFERFWKRELDIEDSEAVASVLRECGADARCFGQFAAGAGRTRLQQIQTDAESRGVFGVPSFLFDDGELFWGREHIAAVRRRLDEARAYPPRR